MVRSSGLREGSQAQVEHLPAIQETKRRPLAEPACGQVYGSSSWGCHEGTGLPELVWTVFHTEQRPLQVSSGRKGLLAG